MASIIRVKHRLTGGGGAGSPTSIDPSGSVSINYDVGTGRTPELWGSDGVAWRKLNPVAPAPTVGSPALAGGTTGSKVGIGAAWGLLTPKPTDPLVVASFAGGAYIKTGVGTSDGDWTSLGSASTFASAAEIIAGTETGKGINPAMLRAVAPNASAGTADADKLARLDANGHLSATFLDTSVGGAATEAGKFVILDAAGHVPATAIDAITSPTGGSVAVAGDSGKFIQLNAAGQIDSKFISLSAVAFKDTVDLAVTPPVTWKTGDYGVAKADVSQAAINAGFGLTTDVKKGDMIIKTATGWEALAQDVDLSAYVSKSGANAIAADMVMTWTAPGTLTTLIDGADATKSKIDNVQVDCGTF